MRKLLLTIVAILLLLYLGILLSVFFFQETFIFHPDHILADYSFEQYPEAEEVFLDASDGGRINALYFKARSDKGRSNEVLLYFHGNAGALDRWGNVAYDFTKHDHDVFIIDYRTYGKSTGKMSQKALYDDAQLAYDFLRERYPERSIKIYGRSIGTGIASHLASNNKAGALILETPYFNLMDLAKDYFKFLPKGKLLKYTFENDKHLRNADMPAYIFHGTADRIVPLESGLKLEPLLEDNHFFIIQGANHHNISEYPLYHEKLGQILKGEI